MKTKIFSLMCLSILALVLVIGFGSAAVTYTETFDNLELTATYVNNSFVGNDDITWNYVEARNEGDYAISGNGLMLRGLTDYNSKIYSSTIAGGIISFSVQLKKGFAEEGDRQVELYINGELKDTSEAFDDPATHLFTVENINIEGDFTIEIRNIKDKQIVIDDITWTEYTAEEPEPEQQLTCGDIVEGSLRVDIKDITVVRGFGDDEEWVPLDEIEVEVEIENKNDDEKIKDIEVEWGLYSEETAEWVIELDEVDEFDLKKDSDERIIIAFKLNERQLEVDFDELEDGDYTLYVRAIGKEQEDSEFDVCSINSEPVKVFIESDFLVLDNFQIEGISLDEGKFYPDKLSCESTLQLTADIWNIGNSDQEDIEIRIYNYDFGIDETLEIGDVNAFDSESISFEFTIPEGMEEGWNTLEFTIQEDGDIFENDYVDEDAEFEVLLDLENCALAQALVSAALDEGGKAGKELIIRATIKNTGSESTSYLVNALGYAEWASLVDVEPSTFILQAGQSAEVLITLEINRDVSGERLFNIEVLSEGELVVSQPLSVSIEKALIEDLFGDNGLLTALIIGIAIILIVIIIVLAVRVARR